MANVENCGWAKGLKINTFFSKIFGQYFLCNLIIPATFFAMTINIHTNLLSFFFISVLTQLGATHLF